MKRSWARRTAELHDEIAAITEPDAGWWLFAGGVAAAEPWGERSQYVRSNAEPGADTFMGVRSPWPDDPIADAIARARAARTVLRELEGVLPEQHLAVTIQRPGNGAANGHTDGKKGTRALVPSELDCVAFAIGDECLVSELDDPALPARLAAFAGGAIPPRWRGPVPFTCVSIGDDAIETARHGHRRAWIDGCGPWLGLGRTGDLATVSTCHLVVDGYGHARITGRIAELMATVASGPRTGASGPGTVAGVADRKIELPPLAPIPDAIPLGVAWRELPRPTANVLRFAYSVGRLLHRRAGKPEARFSPTFQIPIAPGDRDDPDRIRRRVLPGIVSVRFERGQPEPFSQFETRVRAVLAREVRGQGLCSRLLAAARGVPAPLAWKRTGISAATRPAWLDRFANVIGGRACMSKIRLDAKLPPTCAVSSPSRLVTPSDPVGGCVVTVVDDGIHAAITACGSGLAGTRAAAERMIDELLVLVADR